MYFVYRNKRYVDCTGLSFRVCFLSPSSLTPKSTQIKLRKTLTLVNFEMCRILWQESCLLFLGSYLPLMIGKIIWLLFSLRFFFLLIFLIIFFLWWEILTCGTFIFKVRLKRYLEMRGADGGPWRRLCALPAFWVYSENLLFLILKDNQFTIYCPRLCALLNSYFL